MQNTCRTPLLASYLPVWGPLLLPHSTSTVALRICGGGGADPDPPSWESTSWGLLGCMDSQRTVCNSTHSFKFDVRWGVAVEFYVAIETCPRVGRACPKSARPHTGRTTQPGYTNPFSGGPVPLKPRGQWRRWTLGHHLQGQAATTSTSNSRSSVRMQEYLGGQVPIHAHHITSHHLT